ncbi:MAG: hypothetical protein EPO08_06365 [Rhodospirillaceae bacterium]|nr:MAG: hypothetical protein EPO08_06365 [Rhodospirillaceae bacterium]
MSSSRSHAWCLIVLAALVLPVLAGCGSVPQPFRGTPKVTHDNPLLDVPAATGVAILPVGGLPTPLSDAFTKAIADRLEALEIPAATVPQSGALGFIVSGQAGPVSDGPTGQSFDVAWTVKSRHGGIAGHFVQVVSITPGEGGSTAAAAVTAKLITGAMGLTDEVPTAAGSTTVGGTPKIPSVSVKPVDGAPGDGRQALALAVLQALSDVGVRRDDVRPDVVLFGKVEAKPANLSSQDVAISWRAVARDGRELGTVKVENIIPNGVLDGPWGPTAFAIAAAAQQDLLRLISLGPAS